MEEREKDVVWTEDEVIDKVLDTLKNEITERNGCVGFRKPPTVLGDYGFTHFRIPGFVSGFSDENYTVICHEDEEFLENLKKKFLENKEKGMYKKC